ncbi:GNAT family N-acetyltransferase [Nemorincola caseinilytica]|uniref:GNAT family N-acetyltransferase n=1 Tax=Nemorincola caseinilytica TaxID=2054315 RepID=A0ABP8N623_9BACT
MQHITTSYKDYIITTDKSLMNLADIHKWLSEEAYWSKEIPYDTVRTLFENSYCIGAMKGTEQIAFARLVTDYATFGYLADVYVVEAHRGEGISKQMLDLLFGMDWVKYLRRTMLSTIYAHDLYRKYGFTECRYPDRLMEILRSPDMYKQMTEET